jgi:peptidoglycan/xylan/chitin deacetylase (PgdA/CDA1 family)
VTSKSELLAQTMEIFGLRAALTRATAWHGLICLTYHRIGVPSADDGFDPELWSASAADFDAQIRHLKRHFDVITADDLDAVRRTDGGRYVMVTFDDGYRDNYDVAFPILKAHGVRATFFVATGFLDQPHLAWWDELSWMLSRSRRPVLDAGRWFPAPLTLERSGRAAVLRQLLAKYKQLAEAETAEFLDHVAATTGSGRYGAAVPDGMWMTWPMVRDLSRSGMAIGGHTVSHPVLARLSAQRQQEEIKGSLDRIEQETGTRPVAFSYPVGDRTAYSAVTQQCLRQLGVRYAFGFSGGFERSARAWQPLDLRRSAIEADVSGPRFRSMLAIPQLFARSAAEA